jgi:hypothetical protein
MYLYWKLAENKEEVARYWACRKETERFKTHNGKEVQRSSIRDDLIRKYKNKVLGVTESIIHGTYSGGKYLFCGIKCIMFC